MELDDLKTAWQALEQRLVAIEAREVSLVRDAKVGKVRGRLRVLAVGQIIQIALAVALIGLAAPFWVAHRETAHLLLAGLAFHGYGLAAIVMSARQLFLLATIDYAAPVVTIQHKLAVLRRVRVQAELALGLPWWFLWVVAVLIGAKVLADIDLYAAAPGWILGSLAVGAAGVVLTLWLPRRFATTPLGSRFLQGCLDTLAGRTLVRATRELDELAEFSRE